MTEMQPQTYPAVSMARPLVRAKLTRKPLLKWNGNSAIGRRIRDLYRAIQRAAGDPADAITQAHVMGLAETIVAIEAHRARAVRGEAVDLAVLVRMQNTVSRELRRLGIRSTGTAPGPAIPTVAELLARPK